MRDAFAPAAGSAVVTIAAALDDGEPSGHFNGKLESPAVFERALTGADTDALDRGAAPWELDPPPLAAWDFGRDVSGTSFVDVVGSYHGEFVNQPTRAVTGHRWCGRTFDFKIGAARVRGRPLSRRRSRGRGLGADVLVCRHRRSATAAFTRSGSRPGRPWTRFRSSSGPRVSAPQSSVLLLAPTMTYRAYANEHESWFDREERSDQNRIRGASVGRGRVRGPGRPPQPLRPSFRRLGHDVRLAASTADNDAASHQHAGLRCATRSRRGSLSRRLARGTRHGLRRRGGRGSRIRQAASSSIPIRGRSYRHASRVLDGADARRDDGLRRARRPPHVSRR